MFALLEKTSWLPDRLRTEEWSRVTVGRVEVERDVDENASLGVGGNTAMSVKAMMIASASEAKRRLCLPW